MTSENNRTRRLAFPDDTDSYLGTGRRYGAGANPLVEYGLMGALMSVPMVVWIRHRERTWSNGLEMTLATVRRTNRREVAVHGFTSYRRGAFGPCRRAVGTVEADPEWGRR